MHQALYRKWRPQTFTEVCGQEHVTRILKYEVAQGLQSHAYLFCGSRGTGKTSCAKILSRAVNCESPKDGDPCGVCPSCVAISEGRTTDVLEMDAASNNSVDDIRTILDEVMFTPGSLKYRVYIIDEVHMLSQSAFNALLKTLEEPPSHVIFILATTEIQKLPATIVSRCQRFDFHRLSTSDIKNRLHVIAEAEGIELDDDASLILSRLAEGGMRDAISLLELCSAGGGRVDAKRVSAAAGWSGRGATSSFVKAVARRDTADLFRQIAEKDSSASDITVFWQEIISYYRDMLVISTAGRSGAAAYLDLTDSECETLAQDAAMFTREALSYQCKKIDEALTLMQRPGVSRRIQAELCAVRLCDERLDASTDAILARIAALESGTRASAAAPADAAKPATPAAPAENKEAKHSPAVPSPAAKAAAAASEGSDKKSAESSAPAGDNASAAPVKVKNWPDVIERFKASAPGPAAFLQACRAYVTNDGGATKVTVYYKNEVTRMLLSSPETLKKFCMALEEAAGISVAPGNVIFVQSSSDEPAPDELKQEIESFIKF